MKERKNIVLVNSISLNMTDAEKGVFKFQRMTIEEAKELLRSAEKVSSFIGHPDLARVASTVLDFYVEPNRGNYTASEDDVIIVLQYRGSRLPEGTTQLPEGAEIVPYQVEFRIPRRAGIYFWEVELPCRDCEEGNPTHNPGHWPHTEITFSFNDEPAPEKDARLVDYLSPEKIQEYYPGFSWTQAAIRHCDWLQH